jgi:hypothetical protein
MRRRLGKAGDTTWRGGDHSNLASFAVIFVDTARGPSSRLHAPGGLRGHDHRLLHVPPRPGVHVGPALYEALHRLLRGTPAGLGGVDPHHGRRHRPHALLRGLSAFNIERGPHRAGGRHRLPFPGHRLRRSRPEDRGTAMESGCSASSCSGGQSLLLRRSNRAVRLIRRLRIRGALLLLCAVPIAAWQRAGGSRPAAGSY